MFGPQCGVTSTPPGVDEAAMSRAAFADGVEQPGGSAVPKVDPCNAGPLDVGGEVRGVVGGGNDDESVPAGVE